MASDRRDHGMRGGGADVCRAPGCAKKRLGSSDLCSEHLNERLRIERESRDRVREKAGNWAAWQTPGPTLDAVAGKAPSEDAVASAARKEELVSVRADMSRRLDLEIARIPWPALLGALGPRQAAKALERALTNLTPEKELQAWRFVGGLLDGRGDDPAWREESLASLDAAIQGPAKALVELFHRLRPETPTAREGQEAVPAEADTPPPPPPARPTRTPLEEAIDAAKARATSLDDAVKLAQEAGERTFRLGAEAWKDAAREGGPMEQAERLAREALGKGARAFEDAARKGGSPFDPAAFFAFAGEATESLAGTLKDVMNPSLVKILTGGRVDPAALRRGADKIAGAAKEGASLFRRRLEGRYETDAYGVDQDLAAWARSLLAILYRRWWRVAATGLSHVPAKGPVVIVANRSLALPWDAAMIATALREDRRPPRDVRLLVLDWLAGVPFVAELLGKTGVLLARVENQERLLADGEAVVLFPEGQGALERPRRERYQVMRFGRGEFVAKALASGAPIVPCAVVGAEESSPALFRLGILGRALGFPSLPAPLLPLPLPTKWHIRFGAPIAAASLVPKESATDPARLSEAADKVRDAVQTLVHEGLAARDGIFR